MRRHQHDEQSKYPTTARNGLLRRCIVLLVLLLSLPASAQFIRLNLVIPPKTSQTEVLPFELVQRLDSKDGVESIRGDGIICLSAAENLKILATLSHDKYLTSETEKDIPLEAYLSFRNDGKSLPPGTAVDHVAIFSLSDSNQVIEYMKGNPEVLNAYLFIHVVAKIPGGAKTLYSGNIHLTIEYN